MYEHKKRCRGHRELTSLEMLCLLIWMHFELKYRVKHLVFSCFALFSKMFEVVAFTIIFMIENQFSLEHYHTLK
jgi:hypothetical protein